MEQRLQVLFDVLAVSRLDVPVEGVLDALLDGVLRLPPEQLLGAGRVRRPVTDALGLVRHVVDFVGLPAEVVENDVDGLVHRHVSADAGVYRSPVRDIFGGETKCTSDVLDVGEVSRLLAVTPDPEGILTGVGFGHECNDRVRLVLTWAVGREDANRTGVDVVLFVVGLERPFAHQLCPPVHFVGVGTAALVEAHHVLAEAPALLLDVRRIGAGAGGEADPVDAVLRGRLVDDVVQRHVRGAVGRILGDVPPATVVRGEVEDRIDGLGGLVRKLPVFEVAADDVDVVFDRSEVLRLTAGEVVSDADVRALGNEVLYEVAADERCATSDEYAFALPLAHASPPSATAACFVPSSSVSAHW